MKPFTERASEFITEIISAIYPILQHGEITTECNNDVVEISILDDNSTIWVNWESKYHCKFIDLPIIAMAAIADILFLESNTAIGLKDNKDDQEKKN